MPDFYNNGLRKDIWAVLDVVKQLKKNRLNDHPPKIPTQLPQQHALFRFLPRPPWWRMRWVTCGSAIWSHQNGGMTCGWRKGSPPGWTCYLWMCLGGGVERFHRRNWRGEFVVLYVLYLELEKRLSAFRVYTFDVRYSIPTNPWFQA